MKRFVFLAALLAASAMAVPVGAKQSDSSRGGKDKASGGIDLTVHTHTSGLGGPGGAPLLTETDPLSFPVQEETFSYASVPCSTPAPFNDRALEFNPDYPGIDDPASARFITEGEVTDVSKSGKKADVEGTITMFLCENGAEGDQIVFAYDAKLLVRSDNLAAVRGTFDIVSGTGRFAEIDGQGSLHGRLTCLERVLARAGAESCADYGAFTDAVFFRGPTDDPSPEDITGGLKGHYEDPTVPTS